MDSEVPKSSHTLQLDPLSTLILFKALLSKSILINKDFLLP